MNYPQFLYTNSNFIIIILLRCIWEFFGNKQPARRLGILDKHMYSLESQRTDKIILWACIFWKKKIRQDKKKYYVAFFILAFRDARMSEDEN